MKILLINNVFRKGSTGNIVGSLFLEYKKQGHDVSVIYGRGKKNKEENIYKKTYELESKIHHFSSLFTGNMYGGMPISTHRIITQIKKIKPDVVNLHCMNGYFVNIYKLLKWLAKNNVKTVLTMHADFMMTGGCGITVDCNNYICCECKNCKNVKQFNGRFSLNRTHHFYNKFKKALSYFDKSNIKITCVSNWLRDRFQKSPLYKEFEIETILNPVDQIFFTEYGENPYKNKEHNVLYVTPDIHDYVKAGWQIKDIANLRKDLNFTIICTKDVPFEFDNKNITYIKGGVSKEKLRDYYHYADATLILSRRETFSMVVAESLACGTLVFGFKCGGPETISIPEFSSFYEFGDIESLSNDLIKKTYSKEQVVKASSKYKSSTIAKEYLDFYRF